MPIERRQQPASPHADAPPPAVNSPACSGLRRLWPAAFLAALALYGATASRSPQWQDSGWQQVRILSSQIEHPLGLALTHPLQFWLGRTALHLLPLEPAFAITLVSSLAAALAVANTAGIIFLLTRRASAALLAGGALMLSHTLWQHATHTESYALVAALLTTEWLCLAAYSVTRRPWLLVALATANGLGLANHLLAALATPVDVVILLLAVRQARLTPRLFGLAAAAWLLASAPFTGLIVQTTLSTGDLTGTLRSAFFGNFAPNVLNIHLNGRMIALTFSYLAYNFPGLIVPLAIYGLTRRSPTLGGFTRPLKWLLLIYLVFVARYSITDQYTFFIPVYLLLAISAGLGIAALPSTAPRAWRVLLPILIVTSFWQPLLYAGTAALLARRSAFASFVRNKPYRDGYQALFVPWGAGKDYAEKLNAEALRLAGDRGVILVEDTMMVFSLDYARLLGRIPAAVEIRQFHYTPAEHRALLALLSAAQPVVLVPRDRDRPPPPPPGTSWRRDNDLYVLHRNNPSETGR